MIAKMIFKGPIENPKPLVKIGMAFLAISQAWPRLLPVTGNLGPDAIDGIRGLLMGIGVGLACWAAMLIGRQRRTRGM
jgi:hypothetical protein